MKEYIKLPFLQKKFKQNESSLTPNLRPYRSLDAPLSRNFLLVAWRFNITRLYCNVTIIMQLLLYLQLGSSCTGFPSTFNVLTLSQPLSPGRRLSVSERENNYDSWVCTRHKCSKIVSNACLQTYPLPNSLVFLVTILLLQLLQGCQGLYFCLPLPEVGNKL